AEQLLSVVFSGRQGSPVCVEHVPPVQVSVPLQNTPSLHAVPLGSFAVQLSSTSLQEAAQLLSPVLSGRHGSPEWTEQLPPEHVSVPLQNRLSVHGAVLFGCVQVPVALHLSSVQTLRSLVHAVPAGWKPLSVQLPEPLHRSWFVQSVPVSPHRW